MRIQGTFLHSVVARRLFWSLLAAALVPLVLAGALSYRALDAQLRAQAQRADTELAKHVGLRVYDRLVAARAALSAYAQAADWAQPRPPSGELRPVLRSVASVDPTGASAGGDAALVQAWRQAAQPMLPPGQRTLWWVVREGGQEPVIVVSQADTAGRGRWLAEVEPAYLWADFVPDGVGAPACAHDDRERVLRCADAVSKDAPETVWPLFLEASFGSPDWRFHVARDGTPWLAGARIGPWALQTAVATLLLISVLSLMQVRRIMVPLERLSAATRRLAGGEWGTRVELPPRDEFGQLAGSLNAMAERIEHQLQTLEVNAAIDRAILDGVDVETVMRRVAGRIEALLPGARVAIAARAADGSGWRAHRADGPGDALRMAEADLRRRPIDGLAVHAGQDEPAEWARQALRLGAAERPAICWVPALWQHELLALLIVATPRPLTSDPERGSAIGELRDRVAVTLAAAAREHRLVERAVRDGLTGLLNRYGLYEEAAGRLSGTPGDRACALMFIDLDGFKEINDALGHLTGDELLVAVAGRLRELMPPRALLARPGGDEFVVLLPGPAEAAEALAGQLCARVAEPFELHGQVVHVGASVGIAASPEDGADLVELMRRADLAMYDAKAAGRGVWRRYRGLLDELASERAWIVRDLRAALDAGDGLTLQFQPRIDARDGSVHSAEALVRWQHPQRGAIAPGRFIGVAEDSGLIEPLGRLVLERALQQMRRWRDQDLPVGRVAVNVSVRQLRDERFAQQVLQCLADHGLQPGDLELEITESVFASDIDALCVRLAPLRERGVIIALDDFGTGHSSMARLDTMPVDVLKIDRSFVMKLGQSAAGDAFARSVLLLGHALGKRVVAEGVETPLQQAQLVEMGCDEFQGYLFSRPLPAPEFERRVREDFGERLALPA